MRFPLAVLALGMVATPAGAGERPPNASIAGVESCGPDGLRLPGSDSCIRLGGQVRSETALRLGGGTPSRGTAVRNRVEGRVTGDVRVPTELGPLRMYGSVRGWRGD